MFGEISDLSDVIDHQFDKLGVEEIDMDELKRKVNIKAIGNKSEDLMWEEYIDCLEEYYALRGGKGRKIGKEIFVPFHILCGLIPNTNMSALII